MNELQKLLEESGATHVSVSSDYINFTLEGKSVYISLLTFGHDMECEAEFNISVRYDMKP